MADEDNKPHSFNIVAIDLNAALADINEAYVGLRFVQYKVV